MKKHLPIVFILSVLLGIGCAAEGPGGPPEPAIYHINSWDELEGKSGCVIHAVFESPTKGKVPFCAYLPPSWDYHDTIDYPMLIHLYGQGGNEYSFSYAAKTYELNYWMSDELLPPMVIICVNGSRNANAIQWAGRRGPPRGRRRGRGP